MPSNADFIQLFEIGQTTSEVWVPMAVPPGETTTVSIRGVHVSFPGKRVEGLKDRPTMVIHQLQTDVPTTYVVDDLPTLVLKPYHQRFIAGYGSQYLLVEKYTRFATHIEFPEPGHYQIIQADTNEELEEYARKHNILCSRSLAEMLEGAARICRNCGRAKVFEGRYCEPCQDSMGCSGGG